MKWHLIEGEEGCAYAGRRHCVAVVVDALRASATAAMLLDAGVREILVVNELEDAFAAKESWPDALLYGEREGVAPAGFDAGNSPREAGRAAGRRVIFTTTTGSRRLLQCGQAAAVYMGTTLNASALAAAAAAHKTDVVLIPAGLAGDPAFNAQEDWAAAVFVAIRSGAVIGHGADRFDYWRARLNTEGLVRLFMESPHAHKLRQIGLEADIHFCAQSDITEAVPFAAARLERGCLLRNAPADPTGRPEDVSV